MAVLDPIELDTSAALLVGDPPVDVDGGGRHDRAVSTGAALEAVLGDLPGAVRTAGIAEADAPGLSRLLALIRDAQQALEAAVVRIGVRADQLAERGAAAPARETLLGRGRVRARTARTEASRVDLLRRMPGAAEAVAACAVGGAQLDSLARRTGRLTPAEWARLDADRLITDAARLPADTFDAAVARTVEGLVAERELATEEEQRAASELRHWIDPRTGMGRFSGQLDPERYEAVVSAIDHHTAALAATADRPTARSAGLAAEALVELVTCSGIRRAHLPHVTVVVDERTLRTGTHDRSIRQTGDGHELSDAAVARLCCEAVLRRVTTDRRGVPIDVGRRHRTATDAQWAAIRAVYSSCGWRGCDRVLSHCQLHHIRPWGSGGATDLANLVPLCSHHHHAVHEGRWTVRLRPNRALVITRPDGLHHSTSDPPTRRPTIAASRYLTTP